MSTPTPSPDIVLRGHRESINCLKFIQSNLLVSGDGEGCLKFWDLDIRRASYEYQPSSKSILTLSFIHSSNSLISCSRDGFLRTLDVETLSNESTPSFSEIYCGVQHFCGAATDVSQSDQFTLISPSSDENRGLIWDLRSPNHNSSADFQLPTECGMLTSLHYNTNLFNCRNSEDQFTMGQILAGGEDGSLVAFDMRSLSRPYDTLKLHKEPVLTISSTNQIVVTGSSGREIQLVTSSSSSPPPSPITTILNNPGTGCSAIHQSSKIFLTGHWDGTVRLFTKKMKPLAILSHHQGGVYSADYSSNSNSSGSIFATGSKDCTIAVWSLYSNQI